MTTPFHIETGRLTVPVTAEDHVRGDAGAPVTLVEYGDYQCPYCGAAYPIVEELLRVRSGRVRLVFRNFPLTDVHPHAAAAAEFAESAPAGRFWDAHDWLFTHQDRLDPDSLAAAAAALDPSGSMAQAMDRRVHADRIRHDFLGGVRSGVNGTPTFFVDGRRHDDDYALATLTAAVDAAARTSG
ncbi:DsbA family protein [Hamadaea tsunoensis]|uniref:DsbA family protein n=1 Tax=Hamadaea tsunoensis TaxID=53368 RepID=UPI0003F726FC|nr:thioredoxin domain-containing protein [Hamadaea tsunoensis]